jgi:LacI family transcriptional regulator
LPTTMKDIAAHLGISPSTVSRAINNTGYVSGDLQAKVHRAILDLDYQPNLLARGLRKKSSSLVGVIVPDLMNAYYTGAAQIIEGLLAAREYRLVLSVHNDDPASELSYLQAMQMQRVAGVIISTTGKNHDYLKYLLREGIPVVAHAREVRYKSVDNAILADKEGAYTAVKHLIDLGHRRIGVICGPQGLSTGQERLAGYLNCLRDAGIPVDQSLIKIGVFQRAFGDEAMAELLGQGPMPTAVFAAGGELTAGVLKALSERRIRIPDQISVVGYDDPEWFSFWNPPLTTVRVPIQRVSELTVELLLRRLSAGKTPHRSITYRLPGSFVVRSSTAAPSDERVAVEISMSEE